MRTNLRGKGLCLLLWVIFFSVPVAFGAEHDTIRVGYYDRNAVIAPIFGTFYHRLKALCCIRASIKAGRFALDSDSSSNAQERKMLASQIRAQESYLSTAYTEIYATLERVLVACASKSVQQDVNLIVNEKSVLYCSANIEQQLRTANFTDQIRLCLASRERLEPGWLFLNPSTYFESSKGSAKFCSAPFEPVSGTVLEGPIAYVDAAFLRQFVYGRLTPDMVAALQRANQKLQQDADREIEQLDQNDKYRANKIEKIEQKFAEDYVPLVADSSALLSQNEEALRAAISQTANEKGIALVLDPSECIDRAGVLKSVSNITADIMRKLSR